MARRHSEEFRREAIRIALIKKLYNINGASGNNRLKGEKII